jgi:predicted nucleic acid-binding protein
LKKILDSSPVIAFYSELDNPDLLHEFIKLGYELRIPKAVFDELENVKTSEKLKSSITEGKIEVILWWLKLKSDANKHYCIIDDKKARKVAGKYQVVFTGTIGLIDLLQKKQAITQDGRTESINKLSVSGFRIKGIS